MATLWGGARPAGSRGSRRGRGRGGGSSSSGSGVPPLPPAAPPQCFSLEEDEPGLPLTSLQAGTILEAEEILGAMQSYFDSSMISVIEDFGSLTESKTCLDVPNELSLLTAITEILDSTDDETLSPFDTTVDSELLTSPRERESSSFQKFLSLSRPSPEHSIPALDDPRGPSSTATVGKAEPGSEHLPWDHPLSCLEDLATPKKLSGRVSQVERPLPRPQPLPQHSDGEEEKEAAAGPGQHGSVEVAGLLMESMVDFDLEDETELETGWPGECDTPCIINTGSVSLSELVRSMHPYCLPSLAVCLDPASEPAAQEFLIGPLTLEMVPGEGEGLESPMGQQPLSPGAKLPAEEERASACLAGKEDGALELLPTDDVVPEDWLGAPAQGLDAESPGSTPLEEPHCSPQARGSPWGMGPRVKDEARQRDRRLESSSQRSMEVPASGKLQGTEKGRGRERARKSRKKKKEELQKGQIRPDEGAVVHRLGSASLVKLEGPQQSPSRAAHPSLQVSTFLEKQLWQAQKEGRVEQQSSRASKTGGTAVEGSALQRKAHSELLKKPKAAEPDPQPAGPPASLELPLPGSEEQPAVVGPGPAEQGEGPVECGQGSRSAPVQENTSLEAAPHLSCGDLCAEGEESTAWPSKEARPKALSLREYRLRMLHRQPGGGDRKDSERPAASKWPSIPEAPTELAEIPCLLVPARPPPSQPAQPVKVPSSPRDPEKPSSPPTAPPLASKVPVGAPQTMPAPVPQGPLLPLLPPATGAAPAGILPPSASPYSLYPPVPSWPCFGSPPVGYPGLPPPPAPVPGGSPNAFHVVPSLPPPPLAWSAPALPPPSFGPGVPCAPMGWPLGLQPSYWPGVPLPPSAPPMLYGDAGTAPQSPGAEPYPASPLHESAQAPRPEVLVQGTACAHMPAQTTPALSYQDISAFTAQPTAAGQAMSAAKHGGPDQPPQWDVRPLARAAAGRASDPRRQSRSVGESPARQPSIAATVTPPAGVFSASSPWPVEEAPVPLHMGEPAAPPARESPAPQAVGEPTAPPARESPAPQAVGEPTAPPARESPAPQAVGEPTAPPARESPAPQAVGEPTAPPARESPAPQAVGEPIAPPAREPLPQPRGVPSVTTTQPMRDPLKPGPPAEAASPVKVPGVSSLQGARPQEPQLPGPTPSLRKAAVLLRARARSQPATPAPKRPWRHRPLVSPAQPAGSQDVVRAFISEIGIEASDLSSLLEQFEKSEAKKEERRVQHKGDRPVTGNAGSEGSQDKNPLDCLHAPELANVAGLTPPATPPHQLWKPLAAVSLLGKPRSPGAAPREGSQRTAKFIEAKPLSQSKPEGKGSPPSHVGSGDHDYCARGTTQPEEGARLSGLAPSGLGSRWNVKHHQDITIKPLSSLPTRTLDCSGLSPLPAPAPGSSEQLLDTACREQLDHRTSGQSPAAVGASRPSTSVLLSPDASPCRDKEPQTCDPQPKHSAAERSLRCYRRRASRAHASRSFSSTSNGSSASSSSSSSSRSRSRSLSPPPKRVAKVSGRYRSRRSQSSHSSRSSCGSCGRSRGRSSSSSSSSCYSSRSSASSHSRSRSPSPCRSSRRRRRYDYHGSLDPCQRQKLLHKERAIEERRVVFVGKIPSRMTRAELRHRFAIFGDIEECTLHFRAEGDNYGFVTYRYAQEAFAAIESGHKLRRPDEQPFDLCFGGRRQFCRRNYADLDSNREDFDPAPVKSKFDSLDFDTLLKQAQRSLRR